MLNGKAWIAKITVLNGYSWGTGVWDWLCGDLSGFQILLILLTSAYTVFQIRKILKDRKNKKK